MRARWSILATLVAACAVGANPVVDGGPISGQVDVEAQDLTTDFVDPTDDVPDELVVDASDDLPVVAPDAEVLADTSSPDDHVDAPDIVDLGGCTGECAPGSTRACGNCGRQTCSTACAWGPCGGERACAPGQSRACGSCGRQTCSTACEWGGCSGQGACAPGQRRGDGCDACSEQVCSAACQWGGCQLRAGAACEYRGGRNSRGCSRCRCGLQWCLGTCQWSTDCVSCCTTCGGCQ